MTNSIMLINETDDECRIAVVENDLLQEMLIEHTYAGQTKNNIYKGVVVQVQTSLQAAFIDYGAKKHGFLPNAELNPYLYSDKKFHKNEPIQNKISVGQELVIQVTREATAHKGAALTTNITLPGRFMVLMPNSDKGGVSKKIDKVEERERLKSFLAGIESEEHSVIIRTAGLGRSLTELKKDYTGLKKTWNDIWTKFKSLKSPDLILEEPDFVVKTLRDYYSEDIKEVWVDNPETYQKALQFFKQVAPRKQKNLKLFVDDRSLFATYHIERQVEQLTSKNVKLKSGGSIVIDQTEALVAIDVNSGRSNQESNIDSTALRTNLEAAEEIARQLRLRNLGGLVVIDFIDMEVESYRKQVEEKLAESMSKDKAQLRFSPISQFGLLELSRQRLSVGISSTVETTCPVCEGKGKIPSIQASTNLIIRSIRELAAKGNVNRIEGDLPLDLVNALLNERRQSIYDLEMEFDIDIILKADPDTMVFNDRCLKVIQDKKARRRDRQEKEESGKTDSNKKRHGKHGHKKDYAKKHAKSGATDDKTKTDQPIIPEDTVEEEYVEETPVEPEAVIKVEPIEKEDLVEKSVTISSAKDKSEDTNGIHPSCLFTDVRELEDQELEEVTASFENRLKGKIIDAPPKIIDNKYLWKSQNGNNHEDAPTEENQSEDAEAINMDLKSDIEAKPETDKKSKAKTKKPAKKSSTNKREKGQPEEKEVAKEHKTKSSRKKSPGKTADKKKKDLEAEENLAQSDEKASTQKTTAKKAKPAKPKNKTAEEKGDDKTNTGKKTTVKQKSTKKAESKSKAKEDTEKKKPVAKKTTAKKSSTKEAEKSEKTPKKTATKKTATKAEKKEPKKATGTRSKSKKSD